MVLEQLSTAGPVLGAFAMLAAVVLAALVALTSRPRRGPRSRQREREDGRRG